MSCCEQTIIPFTLQGSTVIPYTTSLREKHGQVPSIEVYHLIGGQYIKVHTAPLLDSINPTQITINHGGSATGFIKLY